MLFARRCLLGLTGALVCLLPGSLGLQPIRPIRELRKQVASENLPQGVAATSLSHLGFTEYNLSVPIDHFHNDSRYEPHVDEFFNLRYFFDASHYKPGGPVIVLASGEFTAVGRLPFLQKGIAIKLAEATNGIAVVLEHRYYGTSFPYDNLTTESLRFLHFDQALADTAYFARHVKFHGLEAVDLTPGTGAPWIAYGGSYAGAFVAFLRKLYPELFWGSISSSGVTMAIIDYWQYYEAQRLYGPSECVEVTQKLTHAVDQILLAGRKEEAEEADHQWAQNWDQQRLGKAEPAAVSRVAQLKTVFGLGNITRDTDFASVLSDTMDGWQSTNWDPAVSSPHFGRYCGNATSAELLYPELKERTAAVQTLLKATSYHDEVDTLTGRFLNFIGWVQATHHCDTSVHSQDECFSNVNDAFYRQDDITQIWRAWPYQVCTQWGYFVSGTGVPADRLPLVSRLLDVPYLSTLCRSAFNISTPPDVESVNRHGGFDFSYPRLAIVDGEADSWRAATPHAIVGGRDRKSTTSEPFLLLGGTAGHHWEENGLFDNETTPDLPPPDVRKAQADEIEFVQAWVDEWKTQNAKK